MVSMQAPARRWHGSTPSVTCRAWSQRHGSCGGAPPPAPHQVRLVPMIALSGFLHQMMLNYTPYRGSQNALSPGSSTVLWERVPMRFIDKIYIDGSFVTPHG